MPNDPGFIPRARRADVVAAALNGLTAQRKTLPPWLFYDEQGCRLFYEITRCPEYYLTRTEIGLLRGLGADLLPADLHDAALVEFGGSDEAKARYLLDLPGGRFSTYVSVDVAEAALMAMQRRMRASHPALRVIAVVADFMRPFDLPRLDGDRLGFFPGSTIGNLDPNSAVGFLRTAAQSLGAGSWFLLGADLRKPPALLLPAYNDAAGVTAAFNINLLTRLNREAGADFDLGAFRHEAIWNSSAGRIEMHLVALCDQAVRIDGQTIYFREGETIHTENSYKHTAESVTAFARQGGWEQRRVWTDVNGWFGIFLFRHD